MSGKTLHRHWNVLHTPDRGPERSQAQEARDRPGRAGRRPCRRQGPGGDRTPHPQTAKTRRPSSRSYFPTADGRHVKPGDAVAGYVRGLVRGHDDLAGRVDEVRPGHVRKHVAALKQARRLIKSLLAVAEQ